MATIPRELFGFLRELADHNDRAWFEANKERYRRDVQAPALAWIAAMAAPLAALSPHLTVSPKAQGGSLFRIYRDTRFSADKTPYKTHTGMQFRHDHTVGDVHGPGLYVHLEPGACGLGAGLWQPPTPVLARIRAAIDADRDGWRSVAPTGGWTWMEGSNQRVPRGYPADHPFAVDLKRTTFAVWMPLADDAVTDPGFANDAVARFTATAPLLRWLCAAVELPF